MIPSDHFVKLYNEIFKFLAARGRDELDRYYERVADRQAFFTLEAFKRDGLKGMYDYWERIRIEENCDMTHDFNDRFYHLKMNTCPSLSKVLDNDAEPFSGYCDHCPGWVGRVLARAGYWVVYDLIGRATSQCEMWIFPKKADAEVKRTELLAQRSEDSVQTNFAFMHTDDGRHRTQGPLCAPHRPRIRKA